MKEKILSTIALITAFVPLTAPFIWKPDSPAATAIIIGYCIFAAVSFIYALFLFAKIRKFCFKKKQMNKSNKNEHSGFLRPEAYRLNCYFM